jgi:hypothetical protein
MRDRDSIFAVNSFARGAYQVAACIYYCVVWSIASLFIVWLINAAMQVFQATNP